MILKNVLLISPDIVSRDVILWIIIYGGFVVSLSSKDRTKKAFKYNTLLFWSMLIVIITLAIIAVYAL